MAPDPFTLWLVSLPGSTEAEVHASIQHGAKRQTMESTARVSEQDIRLFSGSGANKNITVSGFVLKYETCVAKCEMGQIQAPRCTATNVTEKGQLNHEVA